MSFLSRFTSKSSRDRSSSSKPASSSSKAPTSTSPLIPLDLPTSTLLQETSSAAPLLLRSPPLSTLVEGNSPTPSRDDDLRSLRSVDTTLWVEVPAGGDSPRTARTRPLPGAGERDGRRADPERERKEWLRVEKAWLGVSEVTLVVDECGAVIRSRGLTTLGLFRPYRLAESPSAQLSLILLFLDYCAEFEVKTPAAEGSGIRGSEASKAVLLHAWREELRYAEVVDVVAVVKWALRHLLYPPPTSFSGTPTPSLSFYTSSFLPRFSTPNAFSAYLLPSLPPSSQRLLLSTLALVQHISAFSSRNAMSARRLCRLIGIYLFGLAPASAEGGWETLYEDWQKAGDVLEGCLQAYLREQTDLPPRLQDLLVNYEDFIARQVRLFGGEKVDEAGGGRQITVVRVEVETRGEGWKVAGDAEVNDQITGLSLATPLPSSPSTSSPVGGPMRRKPVEILLAAFEAGGTTAVGEVDDAGRAWRVVLSAAKEASGADGEEKVKAVVDEETWRVLQLLGLDRAGSSRQRRGSLDRPGGSSPYGTLGGAKSAGNLLSSGKQRNVTPTWDSFATSGFSASTAQLSLDAGGVEVDEFGLPSRSRTLSSRTAVMPKQPKQKPTSRLVSVSIHHLDEGFVDVWLDTLAESRSALSPVAGWPGVIISPLRSSVAHQLEGLDSDSASRVDHLFVLERLLPLDGSTQNGNGLAPPAPSNLNRALSSASSRTARPTGTDETLSPRKKWKRRASAIFSSSSSSSLPTLSSTSGSRREASDSTTSPATSTSTSPFSTLLPSARRSRKSFAVSDSAPPVPALPSLPPLPQSPPPLPEKQLDSPSPPSSAPVAPEEGRGGLVRRMSQQAKQVVGRRTSRVSLSSASNGRPASRAAEDLPPPVPTLTETRRESQLYVSEVPLTPGAEIVPPIASDITHQEEEKEEKGVEPYQVEHETAPSVVAAGEGEGERHMVEEPERAKEEVLEPLREMIAVELEGEKVEESVVQEEKQEGGLKPAPSPFDLESPIDPSTPRPAAQPPSFPLPDQPAAASPHEASTTAAPTDDLIGVQQLETAAEAGGEPEPAEPVEAKEEEQHEAASGVQDAPPMPALPEAAEEPVPTVTEELAAPPVEKPSTSASTSSAPIPVEEVVHSHPEQTVEEAAFTVEPVLPSGSDGEKPDVLHPEPMQEEVKHIEDVSSPPPPPVERNESEEKYDLDLPAASSAADQPTTPTFTLSPPPPEKDLPEPEEEVGKEKRFSEETVKIDEKEGLAAAEGHGEEEKPAEAVGLGLANLPADSFPSAVEDTGPATPSKSLPPVPATATPRTPTSPNLTAETPLSRSLSQGSQTSPAPNSPTPSNSSTGSRKFLANMGSMLRRKKSGLDKEAAKREKEEQKREKEEQKQLRKLREEELKREKRERKAPTPVSNVKARVKEIEEEEIATSGSNSPATPARTRVLSQYGSPTHASPSPNPAGLPRTASIASLRPSRPVSLVSVQQPQPPASEPSPTSDSSPAPPVEAAPVPALDASTLELTASENAEEHVAQPSDPAAVEEEIASPADPEQPLPTLDVPPPTANDEDVTGEIVVPPTATPAQESEHLSVKLPSSLDDLPSPLPSPSPQPVSTIEVAPLASDDDLTQPIPDLQPPVFIVQPAVEDYLPPGDAEEEPLGRIEDNHTGPIPSISIASPAPAQESEHLHVKVPASYEDLPSPIPSPTPRDEDGEAEPLAEDLTETIPEIRPPVFLASPAKDHVGEPEKEVVEGVEGNIPDEQTAFTIAPAHHSGDVQDPFVEEPNHPGSIPTSISQNDLRSASPAFNFPSTPTKPSVASTTVEGTPNANGVHSTPVAAAQDDVFSSPAPSAAPAVEATPTKSGPPPALAQVIRASPSQYSISTTTSFQTADSSAQSSIDERWEAPDETF